MLYRSAYTERTRVLEQNSNHQDISSIAGASWKIETPEVRAQYEEWARLERANHQKAFPDYKFQPQSQAVKERKRKQMNDGSSEDATDEDDPLYCQHRGKSSTPAGSLRGKRARATYREFSGSPSFASSDEVHTPESYFSLDGPNSSYFANAKSGKPLPAVIERSNQQNAYFVTSHPTDPYNEFGHFDADGVTDEAHLFPADDQAAFSSTPLGLPGANNGLLGILPLADDQLLLGTGQLLDPDLNGDHHDIGNSDTHFPQQSARALSFHRDDFLNDTDNGQYQLSQFTHEGDF